MFYQEVGRTKKYIRKRVGFVRSFEQVIKNLNDEAWREFHYMKAKVRGVDYTLVYDLENKGTSYAKADVFLYNYDYLFNSVGLALVPRAKSDNPIYHGSGIYESRYGLKVVKLVSELRGLDLLCERCKPWIFNLPEVGWGDFWVIPMTVEGFMGTLYYGTYSKDEVREIYESKGIGLI